MIKRLSLIFIVLASVFAFQPALPPAPRTIATTEVVLIERQESIEVPATPVVATAVSRNKIVLVPNTLPGVRSTRHLVECLQHHSSLSC
jgi:hypothetical protein